MLGVVPQGIATAVSEQVARVLAWCADGSLVRPGSAPDPVDLARAIAHSCGVVGLPMPAGDLIGRLGSHDHYVFVLVDGLGWRLLNDLDRAGSGFLAGAATGPMHALFPSTTAVVLTSLATACHPATHGITGWWTHFPELGVTAEVLPFVERFSKRPMADFGGSIDQAFPIASLLPRFGHRPLVVTRDYIVGSSYSRYWSGDCDGVAYEGIANGVDRVVDRIDHARGPTYTHLYLNQLDALCHERGVGASDVATLFAEIDRELARLHQRLSGRARLVISSDHGHVDRQVARSIEHGDPLMELLDCPPSGEPRVPVFHVLPGRERDFHERFLDRHGDLFALLSIAELEELELLGPEPLSPRARAGFGDFIAIGPGANTLHYGPLKPHAHAQAGVHGGMTPDEMEIPLVLA